METENKLRLYRNEIKQYFVHEFAGLGDELYYYVNVAIPLKWRYNFGPHATKKINVSDYEKTLIANTALIIGERATFPDRGHGAAQHSGLTRPPVYR